MLWNKQQVYRRTSMPKYDFRLWCGGSPVSLLHIFRINFPRNASGQMLSKKQVWLKIHYYRMCIMTGLPQIPNFNFFFKCSIVDVAVSFIFIKIRLNEENWDYAFDHYLLLFIFIRFYPILVKHATSFPAQFIWHSILQCYEILLK